MGGPGLLPCNLIGNPIPQVAIPCCNPFWPSQPGAADEATRILEAIGWLCGCVATCCASAADVGNPYNRFCISRLPSGDGSSRRRNPERLPRATKLYIYVLHAGGELRIRQQFSE